MLRYVWFHIKYGYLQMLLFVFLLCLSLCSDVGYKLRLIGKWFVYCCKHKGLYIFKFYEYDVVDANKLKSEGVTFKEYKQNKKEDNKFYSLETLLCKNDLRLLVTSFIVDDEATYKVGQICNVPFCWIVEGDVKSSVVIIYNALYEDILKGNRQAWLVLMHEFGHIETHETTKQYSYSAREASADAFSFAYLKATWWEIFVYYVRLGNTRDVRRRMLCGIHTYLSTLFNK